MSYKLFDHHAHIVDTDFENDLDDVLKRAKEAKVENILVPSYDLKSSIRSCELSSKHDFIYSAVGIHPHDAKTCDADTLTMIEHLARTNPKVVAIGEIGLDYYRNLSPVLAQQNAFIEQIRLAQTLELPIVIHDRDAHKDTMDILSLEDAFETGVIMHCYAGSAEMAKEYVKKGAYISLSGTLTYKNAVKLQEVASVVPLENILVETDCPYLTPVPHRGERNEPSYVHFVVQKLAEIKGLSYEEVANKTYENTFRAYRIKGK